MSIFPDIRRLFMSGYTADVIAHRSILNHGVHFIENPFVKNSPVARTRSALSRE